MILSALGSLGAAAIALAAFGIFGSAYASDQQLTLLGLSFLTGAVANALGYWALSR